MRQIQVHLPVSAVERAAQIARDCGDTAPMSLDAREHGRRAAGADALASALLIATVPNHRVGEFLDRVEGCGPTQLVLVPRGVLPMQPPLERVREQVRDVSSRSTLELVVGSLQSLGSWRGMLVYAALSGIVAAYGVIFDTSYLLTAAMLIAPMGAPAMVCVVGAAMGDATMLRRGLLRFGAALLVLAVTAALLGLAVRLQLSTATMEQISSLSLWTVLLAVGGGAAGAISQVSADRDSLVTGTATGFLVAVSLSPPAAVLGLSVALGRWGYVQLMSFLLVLTLSGIIAGGWAALALFGVRPGDVSADRGSRSVRLSLGAVAIVLTAAMVAWQAALVPRFRKADLARDAMSLAREVVREQGEARLLESAAHFTRPDLPGVPGEALLLTVQAQPRDRVSDDVGDRIGRELQRRIGERVRNRLQGVVPFVTVTMRSAPSGSP